MYSAFRGATNLGNGTGTWNWDTSEVTGMGNVFYEAVNFNQDISLWDTSKVTSFSRMFQGATMFNQDIGSWDTALVTSMGSMFKDAVNFNQDISDWSMGNVSSLDMFLDGGALSTSNYDALLIGWDLQNLLSGVSFDAGDSKYCSQTAQDARENMDEFDDWRFSDGGLTNSCLETIDLDVSISDGVDSVDLGDTVIYTVTVRNIANGNATDSSIVDMESAQITNTSWSCSASVGSSCSASGNGAINDTVNIASGGQVLYTVTATLTNDFFSQVTYSVDAQPSLSQTDLDLSNNLATDTNSNSSEVIFANGFE